VRRGLPVELATRSGRSTPTPSPSARATPAAGARPDELHDLLFALGALPRRRRRPVEAVLRGAERGAAGDAAGGARARSVDRRRAAARRVRRLGARRDSPGDPAGAGTSAPAREDAVLAVVRGLLEIAGPITEAELARRLALSAEDIAVACARLEGEGLILRGRYTPGATEMEWCERRLLARVHRLTLGRLRREIEPATPAQLLGFLARWQHFAPGAQLHGDAGLLQVLQQLAGFEAAVGRWEREILPARVAGYHPALLDELCLSGEIMWGRRSHSTAGIHHARATAHLVLAARGAALDDRRARRGAARGFRPSSSPRRCGREARSSTASSRRRPGLGRAKLDEGLWALVASGRVTADVSAPCAARRETAPTVAPAARAPVGGPCSQPRRPARRGGAGPRPPAPCPHRHRGARALRPRRAPAVARHAPLPAAARGRRRDPRRPLRRRFVGEQFALPEAVEALRAGRQKPGEAPPLAPPARDPLFLQTTPGAAGDRRRRACDP
jgi:ATP-dependent Lhr-like helicase